MYFDLKENPVKFYLSFGLTQTKEAFCYVLDI